MTPTLSVSENGDTGLETHSVVIWKIGSHSVKLTVSRKVNNEYMIYILIYSLAKFMKNSDGAIFIAKHFADLCS